MKTPRVYVDNSVIGGCFDAVSRASGYKPIAIHSPQELTPDEDDPGEVL